MLLQGSSEGVKHAAHHPTPLYLLGWMNPFVNSEIVESIWTSHYHEPINKGVHRTRRVANWIVPIQSSRQQTSGISIWIALVRSMSVKVINSYTILIFGIIQIPLRRDREPLNISDNFSPCHEGTHSNHRPGKTTCTPLGTKSHLKL